MYINSLIMKEINDIPRMLEIIKEFIRDVEKIALDISVKGVDKLIYTGCGSSYYAAIRSSHTLMFSSIKMFTLPTSELLWIYLRKVVDENSKKVVLVFSRSGETAEIKALLNIVKNYRNTTIVGFTCNPSSFLASNSDYIIAVKDCMEESVYMTKSFIALSLLGTIFSIKLLENLGYEEFITNSLEKELEILIEVSKTLTQDLNNPMQLANTLLHKSLIVVLGAEDLYPIALEAALKFIEVSYTKAIALHTLEFKHGYTGLLEKPDLSIIILSAINRPSYEYTERLYNELKLTNVDVIHISNSEKADYVIKIKDGSYLETLVYIIPLYYTTIFKALRLGYNPDKPRYIVKTVTKF